MWAGMAANSARASLSSMFSWLYALYECCSHLTVPPPHHRSPVPSHNQSSASVSCASFYVDAGGISLMPSQRMNHGAWGSRSVRSLDTPVYACANIISRLVHHHNGTETALEVHALDMRLDRVQQCRDGVRRDRTRSGLSRGLRSSQLMVVLNAEFLHYRGHSLIKKLDTEWSQSDMQSGKLWKDLLRTSCGVAVQCCPYLKNIRTASRPERLMIHLTVDLEHFMREHDLWARNSQSRREKRNVTENTYNFTDASKTFASTSDAPLPRRTHIRLTCQRWLHHHLSLALAERVRKAL